MAQGDGEYEQASRLFFAARAKSTVAIEREQFLRKGVQALLAGGKPVQAWEAAYREAGNVPPTDPLHAWLMDLALSAGQPREAARLMRESLPLASGAAAMASLLSDPIRSAMSRTARVTATSSVRSK